MSLLLADNATNKGRKKDIKSWILLDSESTTDVFGEYKYLPKI